MTETDPFASWDQLPPVRRAALTARVVLVGAESTGKTTLTQDLVKHYRSRGGVWSNTLWVSEFGVVVEADAELGDLAHRVVAAELRDPEGIAPYSASSAVVLREISREGCLARRLRTDENDAQGERFAGLCRELFPALEEVGIVHW